MDIQFFQIPVILYAFLNILAFAVMTLDKFSAKVNAKRSSENLLLFVAALGPSGALTAMVVFRHKIRHMKFILVPVFFILHMFLFVWMWPHIAG